MDKILHSLNLRNFFLANLSEDDLAALAPFLVEVTLAPGQVLCEIGEVPENVYFPSSAIASLVTVFRDGRSVETGSIGRESGLGLLNAAGPFPMETRAFVQVAGSAFRLPSRILRDRLERSPALNAALRLHLYASAVQAEQFVACNAVHPVEQRLARRLLMTADRVGSAVFPLTQEYMAIMTGVQRTTITRLAGALKRNGIIHYSRGLMTIRDRIRLKAAACECSEVDREQFLALTHAELDG